MKPATKHTAARKQNKPANKPAARQKKQALETKLEDWADKEVILRHLV